MTMNPFYVGQKASQRKAFSYEEVRFYCTRLSGDDNPLHSDDDYARSINFPACIVPGIMVTSLFGGIFGSSLPGNGTVQLGQTAKFMAPVFVNEEVEAVIEITHIRQDKPIITFSTKIYKHDGTLAIDGEAVLKVDLNRLQPLPSKKRKQNQLAETA